MGSGIRSGTRGVYVSFLINVTCYMKDEVIENELRSLYFFDPNKHADFLFFLSLNPIYILECLPVHLNLWVYSRSSLII